MIRLCLPLAADMVPDARYAFRPASGVRTFGKIVAHVGYRYYCAAATGTNPQWSDAIEATHTTKAAVMEQLAAALRGNLVTYQRLIGMVPPSS